MELKVTEPPACSHCDMKMIRYDLPSVTFSDGLGWATTFLWMCANDDCPIFRKGFQQALSQYGHTSSMRAIIEPDTGMESVTPAFTMDKEHFKEFLKIRNEAKKNIRKEKQPPDIDEDDDWPGNDLDPTKGFTEI